VYFDRGLIDAAANLQFITREPLLATLGQSHRYPSGSVSDAVEPRDLGPVPVQASIS
jgi:hypothetical protein